MHLPMTDCMSRHFGPWAIELQWFKNAIAALNAGIITAKAPKELSDKDFHPMVDERGIAQIEVAGQLLKGASKYGGANSILLKKQVRNAADDASAKGILLLVDSPGGTVAGTDELAREIEDAKKKKPVYAHISDMGASAAYWIASQADKVYATPTSEVGSIGTLAVVVDSSEAAEEEGYKVHVLSTGAYKGTGVEGAPISDDQLSYLQSRVDAMNSHFLDAVMRGRGKSKDVVDGWASGKVWLASEAASMGLIDGVLSADDAHKLLLEAIARDPRQAIARADRLHRIAELETRR